MMSYRPRFLYGLVMILCACHPQGDAGRTGQQLRLRGHWNNTSSTAFIPAIVFLNDSMLDLRSTGDTVGHYYYQLSPAWLRLDDHRGHQYKDSIIYCSDSLLILNTIELERRRSTFIKAPEKELTKQP